MIYDLYHDESMVAGYWHGMLLVPESTKTLLLNELESVRTNLKHSAMINLKGVNKESGKPFRAVESWMAIGACALIQKMKSDGSIFSTAKIIYDPTGKRTFEYKLLPSRIGAKFILFHVRDGHSTLSDILDYGAKVETTLRMGLKGGIHILGNSEEAIQIRSFHFDGHEHYGRHIDISRIVDRITNLRDYCSFANPLIIGDGTSDHRQPDSQSYEDCQLLQLTDLLVGGFRTILGECTNKVQMKVCYPISKMLDSWQRGYAGMKHSRWFRGFCVSQCYLENGVWQFEDIEMKKDVPAQLTFFDDILH